jgi:hypothetical protein
MKPLPFQEALEFFTEKEQLPSDWDSATWAAQEPDFRNRAFFSARVSNGRLLDRLQTLIFDFVAQVRDDVTLPDGTQTTVLRVGDRSDFVKQMREFMIEEGIATADEFAGVNQNDLKDIRSMARLNLIFDTNVRQAYSFGQWKQGMTPAARRAFPAARLVREREVKSPRPRHQQNMGEVRLKSDIQWWSNFINDPAIGGFGVPWGPYGYGSGAVQEDVSRREAADLGLRDDGAAIPEYGINEALAASTKGMDPSVKSELLKELRSRRAPRDPVEAAREAAARARRRALERGLENAQRTGEGNRVEEYQRALDAMPSPGFTVRDEGERIVFEAE